MRVSVVGASGKGRLRLTVASKLRSEQCLTGRGLAEGEACALFRVAVRVRGWSRAELAPQTHARPNSRTGSARTKEMQSGSLIHVKRSYKSVSQPLVICKSLRKRRRQSQCCWA